MDMSQIPNANELCEQLAEQLKCAICLNILVEAKSLSCLHAFCEHCLATYIDQAPRNRMVSCPLCKRLTIRSQVQKDFKLRAFCRTLRTFSGQYSESDESCRWSVSSDGSTDSESDSVFGEAKSHGKYNAKSFDENHNDLKPQLDPSYGGNNGPYVYPEASAPPTESCLTIKNTYSIQCDKYFRRLGSAPRGVALIEHKPVLVFEKTLQSVDRKTGKLVRWQRDSVSESMDKALACETFGSGADTQFIVACDDVDYGLMVFDKKGRFDRFLRTRSNENPRTCCIATAPNCIFALNHIKGCVCSFTHNGGDLRCCKDISLCHQTSAQDTMAIVNNKLHIMCAREGRIHRYDLKGTPLTPMQIPLQPTTRTISDTCPPKICGFQDKYLVITAEDGLRIVNVETGQCECEVTGKLSGIVDVTCDERHVTVLHHVTSDSCRVTTLTCSAH